MAIDAYSAHVEAKRKIRKEPCANTGRVRQNLANADSQRWKEGRPTESPQTISDYAAISNWWQTEPDVGRVADGVPNRVDRLACLGNAIVPQVAQAIAPQIINFFHRRDDDGKDYSQV